MLSIRELKSYLMEIGVVSLFDLTLHFNTDADVVRDRLTHLVRKGCVRKCTKTPLCGTRCNQCSALITERYEWVSANSV